MHWTRTPCSVANEENTDHVTRELWESNLSSLQKVEVWKDEQLKEPEWGPVEGVGAQGRREVTRGVVGLLHSLGLKKGTSSIPKKLLHTERFSASRCIYFPLSAKQLGGQLGSGSTCGWESDGLWKGRSQWESCCSSSKEQKTGGTIRGFVTITSNFDRTFKWSVTIISAGMLKQDFLHGCHLIKLQVNKWHDKDHTIGSPPIMRCKARILCYLNSF